MPVKNIQIRPLAISDAKALVEFETENRGFFERYVPPRKLEYFDTDQLTPLIRDLLTGDTAEQNKFYLIVNDAGEIIGRINLADIRREKITTASLGYRVAQAHCERGVATAAVGLLCEEAKTILRLNQITAQAMAVNVGSTRALLRNGFQLVPDEAEIVSLNGRSIELLQYMRKF